MLREMDLFLFICIATFAYLDIVAYPAYSILFWVEWKMHVWESHFMILYWAVQCKEKNAFYLVLGLAVEAFNRSREIISGTRPEPFAKLWPKEMELGTHRTAEPVPRAEPTPNTTSPCPRQIMSNISRARRLASVWYSKGLVKCVWLSTRGVLSFKWKAPLVFLINQRKTGRWDVCRPINYQKRHYF